jgi:hypothetical protein
MIRSSNCLLEIPWAQIVLLLIVGMFLSSYEAGFIQKLERIKHK